MNLIGLVVSSECIHHNVDAGAEGHFALAVIAGDHRVKRIAIVIEGPCRRIVIAADDDGAYAVNIVGC